MKKIDLRRNFLSFAAIMIGAAISALGLVFFLIPCKIVAGGVSGIATVIYYMSGRHFPVGVSMIFMNVFLILLQAKLIGGKSSMKTVFVILLQPVFIDVMMKITENKGLTADPMLACLFGGVLCGIGIGIVFKFGGTTGGTDIVAQIISKYMRFSVGVSLTMTDFTISLISGAILGKIELSLYGIITIFFTSKIIDAVQHGFSYSKVVFVISEQYMFIAEEVMGELGRGVTLIDATGMFTDRPHKMLMIVVNRRQLYDVKEFVRDIDPHAFMIVCDAHEVLGLGFQKIEE
ncbi:MAG: YitT family protein [Candidatus Wallbacteria bacterium]|nr:YitT family protein [Candidatus Wallbacteria bacterium]